eukprot:749382-Hanusia_phi.AAC.1
MLSGSMASQVRCSPSRQTQSSRASLEGGRTVLVCAGLQDLAASDTSVTAPRQLLRPPLR